MKCSIVPAQAKEDDNSKLANKVVDVNEAGCKTWTRMAVHMFLTIEMHPICLSGE